MARATQTVRRGIPSWLRKRMESARIEVETSADPRLVKGCRGTVLAMNDEGDIAVQFDNGLRVCLLHDRDVWWILQTVTTVCYGEPRIWDTRQEAMEYFLEGVMACEGSERDRYATIYSKLREGCDYATDED